jgi:ligand-binding SRPBCC domain-containing protein
MVRLEEITTIQAPLERCFDLARSVEVHLAGNIHFGEQAIAAGRVTSGLIGMSQRVTWRAKHLGIWQNLTSEITSMQPPTYFQDTMIRGAFRFMKHDHYFRALPSGETEMKDVFCFAAPLPILGRIAEVLVLRRYMRNLLHERNLVIKQIAESPEWRNYLPAAPPCES